MGVILRYFSDLGILPDIETFGKKPEIDKEKERGKNARRRLWLTLGMYAAVFLGVLGENLVSMFNANNSIDWSTFGWLRFQVALVITTVIFPPIFRRFSLRRRARGASRCW